VKKIIVAVCVYAASVCGSYAGNFNLNAEAFTVFGHDAGIEYDIDSHTGIKLSFGHDKLPVYLWGSADKIDTRLVGLRGPHYTVYGAGLGLKKEIIKGLSLHIEGGYFMPKGDMPYTRFPINWEQTEGITRYLNNRYNATSDPNGDPNSPENFRGGVFDATSVECSSGYGGEIGFSYDYELIEHLSISASGAYRMIRFGETINGYNDEWLPGWWQHVEDRDLSGIKLGISLNLMF
jgi:hypothetical protein